MKNKKILATMLALLLALLCAGGALAEAVPDADTAAQDMPLGSTDLQVQAALAAQDDAAENRFERAETAGGSYADFYFGSIQTMRGITSLLSLYINIPDYVKVTGAVLRLNYTCSDLILADLSSMTFYMNGTPFNSVGLVVRSDGGQNVVYMDVPIDLMKSGYNLLEIGGYVRLTDNEGCTDDYNGANWVRIADTTCLRVYYDIADSAAELANYPYPFLSLTDETGAQCAVAVSDAAQDGELAAALTILADMGADVSTENELSLARIGETERDHVIYVGLAENTPADLLALLDQELPATGALVQRVTSGGREYLLIVSNEEAALMEAAQLLADSTRVAQLHTQTTYVSVGEAESYVAASQQAASALMGQYTLKDILGHGASFTGPFNQQATLYLPVADDYTLSSESRFSLNIRYSENLDFDRSLMTVYWGSDVPLYSRKLTKNGAAGETVSFAVPADAIGASGTSMTIVFDLEIKDLDCTVRSMNTPWAFVAEDSTLYLPQGENTGLSLGNLPAPFQRASRLNQVLVVLPDDVTAGELELAGRTMAVLGSGSDPYGTLAVVRASSFWNDNYSDYNIVAIGRGDDNKLIQAQNASLFFQYNERRTALLSNSKLVMNEDYAATAGVIQLLQSPYDSDCALLVLTSPDDVGIAALTALFSTETGRWALQKEAVVVDRYGKSVSYQFTSAVQAAETESAPTFTEVVLQNREPMILLLVGMGCMLLLLLGTVIVLVRIRHRRKNEE